MTTSESWSTEQVAADLREDGPGGWRLGAPPPGTPVAQHSGTQYPEAPETQGWRPGSPAPDAPGAAPASTTEPTGDPSTVRVAAPAAPTPAPPPPVAPPAPPAPRPEDWATPPAAPSSTEAETVVRPLDAPMQARPQPGAPPGTPLPGWGESPEPGGAAPPAGGWEPAKKRGFSLKLPKLELKPKAKAAPAARRPARARRRGELTQETMKGALVIVLIAVIAALVAMPGPVHNKFFKKHAPINPVQDSNTVGAVLLTQADLGSGWQPVARDVRAGGLVVASKPATTPSPVPGQAYADFRDCMTGNADAAGTALFRSGNNLVLASAWTDGSRGAAGYDLAVSASSSFVSCIKNELEKSANMALGSSLVVPLHKPSVGDQSIAFRVDAGNVTYDLFAAQQGRAVMIVQDIGAGQQLDLSLGVNGLQAMSARFPADL